MAQWWYLVRSRNDLDLACAVGLSLDRQEQRTCLYGIDPIFIWIADLHVLRCPSSLVLIMSSHFSKPLASNSAGNHSAPLWVATILCLIITTIGVATRLFVRFKALGADDYVIFAWALVGLAQFATMMAGLLRGLAKSTNNLSGETISAAGGVCSHSLASCTTHWLTTSPGRSDFGGALRRHPVPREALRALYRPANTRSRHENITPCVLDPPGTASPVRSCVASYFAGEVLCKCAFDST